MGAFRRYRVDLGFYLSGVILDTCFIVLLAAAKDMMGDSWIPTSAVLFADVVPAFLIKSFAPFFMERIIYPIRILFVIITAVISLEWVAFFNNPWIKLIGIAIGSTSTGFAEILYFAMTSRYSKSTVVSLSAGTGMSGLFASGLYLVLTEVVGMRSKTSLAVIGIFPILLLLTYLVLLHPVPPQMEEDEGPLILNENSKSNSELDSLSKKISYVASELLPKYMGPLFLVYFCEYLINQTVIPVLTTSEEYVVFYFLYNVGVVISRSSIAFIKIRYLWVIAITQLINLIILCLTVYFPLVISISIWVLIPIVVWEGLLGGGTFANAFLRIRNEITPQNRMEFALGVASLGDISGVILASVIGLGLQPYMEKTKR